ncbi:unnamed protein product [Closterium sp. NIES-64]|nr:unnamed protein product [Closterium sp. NIES-64]
MEDLEGLVLFRVAGATGDAVTTIANIASVSRAFARVARAELWPRYCLARAALAEDGEAAAVAAVAARLVREAASADAPRNAASRLARCMSACPGMVRACSIALRVHGASEDPLEESGSHFPIDYHVSDSSALSSALAAQLFVDECFLPAPPSRSSPRPPPCTPSRSSSHRSSRHSNTSHPVLPPCPSPGDDRSVGEVDGGKKRKEREEDGGKGAQEGAAVLMAAAGCGWEQGGEDERGVFENSQKHPVLMAATGRGREQGGEDERFETSLNQEGAAVLMAAGGCGREQEHEDEDEDQPCHVVQEAEVAFESTQKAAVLMAAGGCGDEHEDDDEGKACHVVRGAIAGFKNSRSMGLTLSVAGFKHSR